jgi:hypothetical protein
VAERASQTTTLVYGGVSAEVGLVKTAGKPKAAEHEVRRMIGDVPADEARHRALVEWQERHAPNSPAWREARGLEPIRPARTAADSLPLSDAVRVGPLDELTDDSPLTDVIVAEYDRETAAADPFAGLPAERVEHGITLDDGSWLDLTEELALIDERTRVEGMEVVATISATAVPRRRIIGSHWIALAGSGKRQAKVLGMLWDSLRRTSTAGVVRWTKRTNQSLGIITASGSLRDGTAALCLLECEWSQNLRAPGPKSTEPIKLALELTDAEIEASSSLAVALRRAPGVLDELRDERNGARADLLTAAREGRLGDAVLPEAPAPRDDGGDVVAAMLAARAEVAS